MVKKTSGKGLSVLITYFSKNHTCMCMYKVRQEREREREGLCRIAMIMVMFFQEL